MSNEQGCPPDPAPQAKQTDDIEVVKATAKHWCVKRGDETYSMALDRFAPHNVTVFPHDIAVAVAAVLRTRQDMGVSA